MKGYLHSRSENSRIELGSVAVIGRSPECNLVVSDPRISRRHAMIRLQDDGFWFFDLGSFNGSYVNGSRVTAARKLVPGDVVEFIDQSFRFDQDGGQQESGRAPIGGSDTIAFVRSMPAIILVSDVQGFTSLSEKLNPDDLAQVIGGWYASVESILTQQGATVDKFIGDSVLAYWTAVTPDARLAALRAALQLLEVSRSIQSARQELFAQHDITFGVGVALNIGKVACGGFSQREFTLVGDAVNVTFRLEGLTRRTGHSVLVTADFLKDWPEGTAWCEFSGMHFVKGREQAIEVWAATRFPD